MDLINRLSYSCTKKYTFLQMEGTEIGLYNTTREYI